MRGRVTLTIRFVCSKTYMFVKHSLYQQKVCFLITNVLTRYSSLHQGNNLLLVKENMSNILNMPNKEGHSGTICTHKYRFLNIFNVYWIKKSALKNIMRVYFYSNCLSEYTLTQLNLSMTKVLISCYNVCEL